MNTANTSLIQKSNFPNAHISSKEHQLLLSARLASLTFDSPDLFDLLTQSTSQELDALDFGVVAMDIDCKVLHYNTAESRLSGLPPERVIGRHFFKEVAPCSNNRRVAHKFEQSSLDETIEYTFSLKMKPVPVILRMLKSAGTPVMYLLVSWS